MQHQYQDGKELSSHMSVLIDLVLAWRVMVRMRDVWHGENWR